MNSENRTDNPDDQNESLADRLRFLIGGRSTRAAAKSWRLSYSTLNNYLTRGTEPSLSIAAKIAELEGVSVEWLACGDRPTESIPLSLEENVASYQTKSSATSDPLQFAWSLVFSSLDPGERESLLKLIHKEGVKGILQEVRQRSLLEEKIAGLTLSEREQFYLQAQECISAIESSRKNKT